MLAPASAGCLERVLVLPERRGELVQHQLRHPERHQELLLRRRPLQDRSTHREQPLVRGVRRRHAELLRQFRILGAYHCAHGTHIAEYPGLQRAPKLLPLLHGRPLHRHPHPLLGREVLRMLQQLLELRQPEVLPYSVHLVGPKKIPSSFSIKWATPGLEERTLPLEGASLRIERWSLPLVPSSLLIRSR